MQIIIVKRTDGDLVEWNHRRCDNIAEARQAQADADEGIIVTPLTAWEFGLYQAAFIRRMDVHKDAGWLPYGTKMWEIDDLAVLDDCHLAGISEVMGLA